MNKIKRCPKCKGSGTIGGVYQSEIKQYKSTLDEIKTLTESSEYDGNFVREQLKEILAKHEGNK